MRWKLGHHRHDPRHVDLLVALALAIATVAAWRFFEGGSDTPSKAAFIVPSQSVRW